jgi:endonuclease-3 related protein
MTPRELFEKLYEYYGPQNWWPGEGFEIAIGAILTQNTSWTNVEKALVNLKQKGPLTPELILQLEKDELKKLITPAGYYNQKASYLSNLAKSWLENPHPTREELLAIKGVGEETADSILLYLFNKAEFVVDAYTVRISNRLGFDSSKKKNYWKAFYEQNLEKKPGLYNEFHALLVEHAKAFCTKKTPSCKNCFLQNECNNKKKENRKLII